MLNSPIEIKVHKYLSDVSKGTASMSDETIEMVTSHIREALKKQFAKKEETEPFRLRMSNIGRPYCQLWFQKNKPEEKVSPDNNVSPPETLNVVPSEPEISTEFSSL